ncbi:MAG: HAMP domain-containing sensor histidine kinase [Candidatus Saccharimonadales bacterium]
MFRSATLKLTLWYVLLATCLSMIFSLVMYHLSTQELSEALNRQYTSFTDNDNDHDNIPQPHPEIQNHAQHLLGELIWLNLIVIVSSSGAGYFLARRTLRPIEDAHTAQVRFTADASHELLTPLASMRSDTEVALMDKGLSVKARDTLRGNLHDIERLESLTTHLLDIARYKNKTATHVVLIDMDEIILKVLRQTSHAIRKKHLKIKQNIQPAQVMGEEHALGQLVTIVLDNAIKYSHSRGIITVSLSVIDEVTFTIQDEGIGIPTADLPHLFAPFYRSSNTRSNKEQMDGYGLGLPLAHEIVEAHDGTITIHSKEGVGTTVIIKLPRTGH